MRSVILAPPLRLFAAIAIFAAPGAARAANSPVTLAVDSLTCADRHLSRAVTETLITSLARSRYVAVVDLRGGYARPTRYKLVGSVLPLDSHLIINVRVLDRETGSALPGVAESAMGTRSHLLRLTDDLAGRLALKLSGLSPLPSRGGPMPPRGGPRPYEPTRAELRAIPPEDDVPSEHRPLIDSIASEGRKEMGRFTGVIIDCRGLNIERSMSPRIRRDGGEPIWTGGEADPDFVIEKGIVSYARCMEDAQSLPRAGSRPLVIRAIDLHPDAFRSDPILAPEDADLLLEHAKRDGFLKRFQVIFVTD